jgi:hypothetical protein
MCFRKEEANEAWDEVVHVASAMTHSGYVYQTCVGHVLQEPSAPTAPA